MEPAHEELDALNLISSSNIHEYYESQDTEDPLVLRERAKSFRAGYKNWRMKKPKGATGEVTQLSDSHRNFLDGGPSALAARQASLTQMSGYDSSHSLALMTKKASQVALSRHNSAMPVSHPIEHPIELALPEGEELTIPEGQEAGFMSPNASFRMLPASELGTSTHGPDVTSRGRMESIDGDDLVDIAYVTFDYEENTGIPLPGGLDISMGKGLDISKGRTYSLDVSINTSGAPSGTATPSGGNPNNQSWLKFMVNPYSASADTTAQGPVPLTQKNLGLLQLVDFVPHYERKADHWICHIGVGGFHRSHQAQSLNLLLEKQHKEKTYTGPKWGLCGVGLMEWDSKMFETLKKQDYMFTLVSRGGAGSHSSIVGSIMDFIYCPEDRAAAVERFADPSTHIISLTITEKGYCLNVEGKLDQENFLIKHDLSEPTLPYSAIGLITEGLRVRKERGIVPYTVLSCDNLPMNGSKTKKTVLEYCELVYPDLKSWMEENVCFPNTMVDRITPITEPEHIALCKDDYGVEDGWPVIAEDFLQWVIEDSFSGPRPSWEEAQDGILVVPDVHAYEWMKLRLLNGTHSALSYPSYLSGFRFVDDSLSDALLGAFVVGYMDEVTPTVPEVPGVDLEDYKKALAARFSNPYIKDKLLRLAEDGSQKLVTTMRDPMLELVKQNKSILYIATAIACFIKFMTGVDMDGVAIEGIKDPRLEELKEPCKKAVESKGDPSLTAPLLKMVFGHEVEQSEICVNEISRCLKALVEDGIQSVLTTLLNLPPAPPS
mmetsp:Transcript_23317/g.30297  ORF Transcript_23317/g.30297 Transcript_23317/m.30297 type:complete len:776 (-) Transcript_23317:305-2632(-)|eukprot:CAMPEP_0117750778 /NCGR_PEP_ID=MMETSP0947-20121206/10584_1 /TAXON_ID=44440 /ORGANISM="Chattonella subsalsa, Strain CCMP2191" /LENGTH=775 /DNA_ID=CAMNT_0005569037 /DNA_START=99 /DNA_END=2426 /DNA_ORIENTATION=+